MDTNLHHGHRQQSSAASEIELCSIYATTQEILAAAANQADTCVARVAWCGGWRVEGVSPCIDIPIGGIGWNYGGSLIGYKTTTKKRLKVKQSRQTRVCLRFILRKQKQCVIDQWQGKWVAFLT